MATDSAFSVLRLMTAVLATAVLVVRAGDVQAQAGIPDPDCYGGNVVVIPAGATVVNVSDFFQANNNSLIGVGGDTSSPNLKFFVLTPGCAPNLGAGGGGVVAETSLNRPIVSERFYSSFDTAVVTAAADGGGRIQIGKENLILHPSDPTGNSVYNQFPDLAFGSDGKVTVDLGDPSAFPTAINVDEQGRIFVQCVTGTGTSTTTTFFRLLPNGTLDTSFGIGGFSRVIFGGVGFGGYSIAFTSATGPFYSVGELLRPTGKVDMGVIQVKADGSGPTNGLGGTGTAAFSVGGTNESAFFADLLPDSNLVISGNSDNHAATLVIRPNGTIAQAISDPNGKVTAVGGGRRHRTPGQYHIGKISPAFKPFVERWVFNTLTSNLGKDPVWASPFLNADQPGTIRTVSPQPDGKINVGMAVPSTQTKAGIGQKQSAATFDYGFIRLLGDSIAGTVHEFWNDQLKNYFFTATEIERQSINNGGSGPGWHETGFAFPSGGTSNSCRFRGTLGIGPNSHFYTIDPYECGNVKFDPGWTFESYDFSVTAPGPGGTCPAGTQPVFRAYNNGFAQNNSNHRLTTNLAAYNAQVAAGWSGEGVVMCAPPGGAAPSCVLTLDATSASIAMDGGQGSVAVSGGYGCAWTAVSNAPWITITSATGSTGDGNGSVAYLAAANATQAPRTGTLTIAGASFTVTQAGN